MAASALSANPLGVREVAADGETIRSWSRSESFACSATPSALLHCHMSLPLRNRSVSSVAPSNAMRCLLVPPYQTCIVCEPDSSDLNDVSSSAPGSVGSSGSPNDK